MTISIVTSSDEWVRDANEYIVSSLVAMQQEKEGSLHICLAGGATPKPVYEAFARNPQCAEIAKSRSIHLWVGDEREAAIGSGFRNSEMIASAFKHCSAFIVLHEWPVGQREQAARIYEKELSSFANERVRANKPIFDLTILGMGEDGHTAGLFSLADMQRAALSPQSLVMLTQAPKEPKLRMTLTPQILRSSRRSLILMQGLAKVRILIANLVGEREDPIKHFLTDSCEAIAQL